MKTQRHLKHLSTTRRSAIRKVALCAIAITAAGSSVSLADQSQPVTEQEHMVEPFEIVATDLPVTINLVITDKHGVTISAQKHVHAQLSVGIVGGQLQIRSIGSFQTNQPIEVLVSTRALRGLKIGGAATVNVDKLDTEQLEITGDGSARVRIDQLNLKRLIGDLQGASSMALSGRTQEQQVQISGSASFDGLNLISSRGVFRVQGAADAVVNVTQRLQVVVSEAGSVEYVGNPQVTEQVNGAGTLARR